MVLFTIYFVFLLENLWFQNLPPTFILSLGFRPGLLWPAIFCKTNFCSNCWISLGSRIFSSGSQVLNLGAHPVIKSIFFIINKCIISLHFYRKLVLQMTGHSKPSRKLKDKAKEAAVKSKGQKSEVSNSEGKKKSKKDPALFESADFCPLVFSAASLALSFFEVFFCIFFRTRSLILFHQNFTVTIPKFRHLEISPEIFCVTIRPWRASRLRQPRV